MPLPAPKVPDVARRLVLTVVGWCLIIIGPPLGAATPMIPIGFVIFGVGVGLVVQNSESGRRFINRGSRWGYSKFPWLYNRMPTKIRMALIGYDPLQPTSAEPIASKSAAE